MASKKILVTIEYSKPGTQPPIYVAGSFSSPEWEAQEMQYTTGEGNEHVFRKELKVEEGKEYQYKFRIGLGDWWILNEDSPTVTDNMGNRNNLLAVSKHQEKEENLEETKETAESQLADKKSPVEATPADEAQVEGVPESKSGVPESLGGDLIPTTTPADLTPTQTEQLQDINKISGTSSTENINSTPPATEEEQIEPVEDTTKDHLVDPLASTEAPIMPSSTRDGRDMGGITHLALAISTRSTPSIEDAQSKNVQETKASPQTSSSSDTALTPTSTIDDAVVDGGKENKTVEKVTSPTLVVEKMNLGPRHGDDFGANATVAQKDAHHLRAQDAEPDHVVLRQQSRTPDVAAEVADSAAMLDREQPTPTISDEEAGKIGYRRMSATPINEVANTAAEVADTARTVDADDIVFNRDMEGYIGNLHIDLSLPDWAKNLSFEERNELKKEQKKLRDEENKKLLETPGAKIIAERDSYYSALCRKAQTMARSQETEYQWRDIVRAREAAVEDAYKHGVRFENLDPGEDRHLMQLAQKSTQSYWCKASEARAYPDGYSPQLEADIILEEDKIEFYKYRAKVESGEIVERDLGSIDENDETPAMTNDLRAEGANIKENELKAGGLGSDGNAAELKEPQAEEGIAAYQGAFKENDIEPKEQVFENGDLEVSAVDIGGFGAAGPFDGVRQDGSHTVPSPVTPFVVGNRQLGDDEGNVQEISTGTNGPNILIQPATPGGSSTKTDPLSKPVDIAKATGIEGENGHSQLKQRKREPSPAFDRPLTPSSMRSAGQDAKSKNFLKAFWRVVFVDWIGGLIMRLCGGNRHTATLVVSALLIVTVAPALYFSS